MSLIFGFFDCLEISKWFSVTKINKNNIITLARSFSEDWYITYNRCNHTGLTCVLIQANVCFTFALRRNGIMTRTPSFVMEQNTLQRIVSQIEVKKH